MNKSLSTGLILFFAVHSLPLTADVSSKRNHHGPGWRTYETAPSQLQQAVKRYEERQRNKERTHGVNTGDTGEKTNRDSSDKINKHHRPSRHQENRRQRDTKTDADKQHRQHAESSKRSQHRGNYRHRGNDHRDHRYRREHHRNHRERAEQNYASHPHTKYRYSFLHSLHDYFTPARGNYVSRRGNLQPLGQFKTRSRDTSNPIIPIKQSVRRIELEGAKRNTRIIAAYAELRNGRVIKLHDLEGYLPQGQHRSAVFSHSRHVEKLILWVESTGRKRAYVNVNYRSARA
jgi:hypothetical protein